MGVVVSGLVLVGVSGILNSQSNPSSNSFLTVLGIILVLCAQLLSASQMVVEELLIKKRNYHPLNVVFMEGFWGLTFLYFFIFPIVNLTPQPGVQTPHTNHTVNAFAQVYHDNFIDALVQMMNFPFFYSN